MALALACGTTGEEEEAVEATAEAVEAPPEPVDPFAQHADTIQTLGAGLRGLAQAQPALFEDVGYGSHLTASAVSEGGAPSYVVLSFSFYPADGVTAQPVFADVLRTADGAVRVSRITVGVAQPGRADAYRPPGPVTDLAQVLRLSVMDGGCRLPVLTQAEAQRLFGIDYAPTSRTVAAREVTQHCTEAAAAFRASTLSLTEARVRVSWAERGPGTLAYVAAALATGETARYTEPTFHNVR
jgi:hypothetical protein